MKKLFFLVAAIFSFALCGADLTIAENGKAYADIVIPADAKPQVRFAAKELKNYLEKITSAKFDITGTPGKKINFYLGMGDVSKFKNQQFVIRAKDSRIELYGVDSPKKISYFDLFYDNDQKGTLTAVYNFLDSLGVRWLAPGEQNTYIPEIKTLRIPEQDRNIVPHFPDRQIADAWNFTNYIDSKEYVRNVNDLFLWGIRNNVSSRVLVPGCHSEQGLKLFENPEWLNNKSAQLLSANGKRNPRYSCWTDPLTKKIWMRAVDGYFSGKTPKEAGFPNLRGYIGSSWPHPWNYPDEFMIDPMDHSDAEDGRCRCDRCQNTRKKLGCPPGDDSEIIWGFIADIANYVNKKFPGKNITTLVYPPKHKMPKTVKLPKNIRVRVCIPGARNINFPDKLKQNLNTVKIWSDHCGRENTPLWIYQCINFGRFLPGVPDSYPHLMDRYLQVIKPLAAGAFNENHNMSHTYRNFDVYIYMRMIFDPSRDVEKEIAEYHKLYYGPAAASAKELFNFFENQWSKIDLRIGGGSSSETLGLSGISSRDHARKIVWSEIYGLKEISYIDNVIKRMEKETANAPVFNKRVKLLRKYLFDIMKAERSEVMDKEDMRSKIKIQAAPTTAAKFPTAAEWAKVEPVKLISAVRMNPELKAHASFKLLASKDKLFILVDAQDKDIKLSRTNRAHRNGSQDIWMDNCIELFFFAENSKKFWHVLVNDNNAWSSQTKGRVLMRWTLMPGANIRSVKTANGFRVEAAIPLKQLKTTGKDLRFNITRERNVGKDKTEYSTWSSLGMLGNWHAPDNYGTIEFK